RDVLPPRARDSIAGGEAASGERLLERSGRSPRPSGDHQLRARSDRSEVRGAVSARCHPEAGAARRGTSQALIRFRERLRVYGSTAVPSLACLILATGGSLAVCAARDDTPFN